MNNTLYYGEMAARISSRLHQNPDHIKRIYQIIEKHNDYSDTVHTLCADSAKVFDKIEDLSSEHFIDWHSAFEQYTKSVLDFLLSGRVPNIIDMVSMTAASIENSR